MAAKFSTPLEKEQSSAWGFAGTSLTVELSAPETLREEAPVCPQPTITAAAGVR
ncbi:hypothetical protein H6P81_008694 [Aristolochia fimbriata]|uniref:Uncharacterized protein n=1 Tax=Aristolochia fimbriata TaxID=158543 RepID=A0AAV7EJG6_ARIFI|nr:hypothetical protein H6P81_008694 [Aristolochia fimbriata]